MKMRLKVSSAKLRPFCLGLNVLTDRHSTNDVKENIATQRSTQAQQHHLWPQFCKNKETINSLVQNQIW